MPTLLRHRVLNGSGQPVSGYSATVHPFSGHKYAERQAGDVIVADTTGADGWLEFQLPDDPVGRRRTYWRIEGESEELDLVATVPRGVSTVTTGIGTTLGTVDIEGDLVVPPSAGGGGGSGITAGTTAGQIPVWDGDSYEPQTPQAVTKADVGLGNVDNTSDASKPVSTAQATADTASRARANHTGTQAIDTVKARAAKKNKTDQQDVTAQNNVTAITLQTTTFNRGGIDVATANVIKPGVAAPCIVTAAAYLVGGTAGDRVLLITVNGTAVAEIPATFVSGSTRVAGAAILDLAATDAVGLSLYIGSTGTVTVAGAGGAKDVNLAVAVVGVD